MAPFLFYIRSIFQTPSMIFEELNRREGASDSMLAGYPAVFQK